MGQGMQDKSATSFWKLEAYLRAVGITNEVQKINITPSLLKILPLFGGAVGVTMSIEVPHLSSLGMDLKKNLRSNSIPRMQRGKPGPT